MLWTRCALSVWPAAFASSTTLPAGSFGFLSKDELGLRLLRGGLGLARGCHCLRLGRGDPKRRLELVAKVEAARAKADGRDTDADTERDDACPQLRPPDDH